MSIIRKINLDSTCIYSSNHACYTCVCRNFPMRPNLWKPGFYWLLVVLLYTSSGFLLVCNEILSLSLAVMDNAVIKYTLYLLMEKKKKDLVTHPKDAYNFVFIQNPEPSVPVDGWGWGAGGRAAPLAYFSSRHWVNFRKTLGCADGNWITQVSSSEYLGSWILSSCSPPKEVYLSKFTTRCH